MNMVSFKQSRMDIMSTIVINKKRNYFDAHFGFFFKKHTSREQRFGLTLVWNEEWSDVRKGCSSARTRFSIIVHSTSSSAEITCFFSTFTANTSFVDRCSARSTWRNSLLLHNKLKKYYPLFPTTLPSAISCISSHGLIVLLIDLLGSDRSCLVLCNSSFLCKTL